MKKIFVILICVLLTTVAMLSLKVFVDSIGQDGLRLIGSPVGGFVAAMINLNFYLYAKEWILK